MQNQAAEGGGGVGAIGSADGIHNTEAFKHVALNSAQEIDFSNFCDRMLPYVRQRAISLAKYTLPLLETYFRVVMSDASVQCLQVLLLVMIKRSNTLFKLGVPEFENAIRKMLIQNISAIFHRHPFLVADLKNVLLFHLQKIDNHMVTITHLCHIVGECMCQLACCGDPRITSSMAQQFYGALEMIAYVQLNHVKARLYRQQQKQQQHARGDFAQPSETSQQFVEETRMYLVLISAMSKLGAQCPDLVPRMLLCLANIIKHKECFHPSVNKRANECVRLFRSTSMASTLLSSTGSTQYVGARCLTPFKGWAPPLTIESDTN